MEAKTNGKVIVYELVIENQSGLHARPAAAFVKIANNFSAEITVTKDGDSVNGKSIMGLMTLAAARGTKLVIQVEGDDATAAVDAIQSLAEDNFNEA
jgi:phosphocarrier protein HPr